MSQQVKLVFKSSDFQGSGTDEQTEEYFADLDMHTKKMKAFIVKYFVEPYSGELATNHSGTIAVNPSES